MLSGKEIDCVFNTLIQLNLGYKLGYAGSYARGQADDKSDLDVIVSGKDALSGEDYFKLYHALNKEVNIKFDIVDLAALKEEDDKMDKMLLDMGLEMNDVSAYKTIEKETVWMN